jgi:hypothetical protein
MGMLDRYKKKGGFVQLLVLLETSPKQKQENFLNLIAQENSSWEKALKSKMLNFEKIISWPIEHRCEVFSRVQPLTVAVAIFNLSPEKREQCLEGLGTGEKKKIYQSLLEVKPTQAEINTCIYKIINETRTLISSNILKLEKFDLELAIAENIEESLSSMALQKSLKEMLPGANASSDSNSSAPTELRFELPSSEAKSDGGGSNKDELEFLRKKVNQLTSEHTSLKHEIAVLRNKLEQIKKIA